MMNRLALSTILRATRVNPTIRSVAPYRWVCIPPFSPILSHILLFQQSSQTAGNQGGQGSNVTAGLAGGLTVLIGGEVQITRRHTCIFVF